MKPKIYLFPTIDSHTTPFVGLKDYQKLLEENKILSADLEHFKDYADRLVEFGNLPCLPKDLENLREANAQFTQDNHELLKLVEDLNAENRNLINKWEEQLDHSDYLADLLFAAQQEIKGWKNKWECAVEMAAIAENKLAEKEKQLKNRLSWDNWFNG